MLLVGGQNEQYFEIKRHEVSTSFNWRQLRLHVCMYSRNLAAPIVFRTHTEEHC